MPITVPDAIADLSMTICKSVYRIILGGLDEQVVMTSLIKGLLLGPMLLHWDGNMDSYHKFTSHLQAKLADID
jgi:hypothetical protein